MKLFDFFSSRMFLTTILGGWLVGAGSVFAEANNSIRVVALGGAGDVVFLQHGASHWQPVAIGTQLDPFDRVRTGTNSSVSILWSDQSVLRFDALTELEILPPEASGADQGLHLVRGILSFFHRAQPGRIRVITSGAVAGIKGTEFVLAVAPANGVEQTTLSVIDGRVSFGNAAGTLELTNHEAAVAEPGRAPLRTAGFIANNVLQWCFYYPGVLDLQDLPPAVAGNKNLSESLTDYRAGDLLAALAKYPDALLASSAGENIYRAALRLNSGQISAAESELAQVNVASAGDTQRLAGALKLLIAAVKHESYAGDVRPQLPTEFLAASYYAQSQGGSNSLANALQLAQRAVEKSPEFGFGWERVAELEFGFGRTERAAAALEKALQFSPRNAEALSLKGFLLAAQNQTREAVKQFDRALAADSALGNAWLGRGLCRIRLGELKAGREDLLIAAAMEPQRSALRSYLGKAYGEAGDVQHATHELNLAKQLDLNDPTAWLYSALLNEQNNQINNAVHDLEKSQELNENRAVYRSGLLLDQDRAVRSANLARIYDEAGMPDVAFREAVRAVNSDYADYSAHLFLANSYDQLADPNLVNLRYEPAETTEYLLANLLAPVGAGTLSPTISQQEYSKLFESDGLHFASSTEALTRGAWKQSAAQYGTFGNTSYSLETDYRFDPGERINNDINEINSTFSVKQQLTPHDSLFAQVGWFHNEGGDLTQRYNPNLADATYRSQESQDGSLILGYHHEWQPGVDTLVLATRTPDHTSFTDQNAQTFVFDPLAKTADPISLAENYNAKLTLYLLELQQLLQTGDRHETIAGAKFAYGSLDVDNAESVPPGSILSASGYGFPNPGQLVSGENISSSIERLDAYLYHRWELVDNLWLQGGISYDWVTLPENFLFAPISSQAITRDQVSPKAGLVWVPVKDTVVRLAYTRSLTGASFEQSLSLEPAQIAGFTQAYREVIPEATVGGPTPASPFDTYGIAIEKKFTTGTYLGVGWQLINSAFNRSVGGYNLNFDPTTFLYSLQGPANAQEHLDYSEQALTFTANQLLGRDFSLGLKYQLTHSELEQQFTAVENPVLPLANGATTVSSTLHQLNLSATWNHPSGLFAQFNSLFSLQQNSGFAGEPGDDFWQLNAFAGYRFPRRQAQISIGILNLTDTDYRLEPLTFYNELPHSRTIVMQAAFNF